MKKVLFTFFFFSLLVVGAQAQKASCSKTCTKSEAAACAAKAPSAAMTSSCHDNSAAAAKVDAMDESIESRIDPATGFTYYVRKETSAHTGDASYVNVTFDPTTNSFVNAPAGDAVKATTTGHKSCSGATSGKSCCTAKGAAASTTKTTEKVKS